MKPYLLHVTYRTRPGQREAFLRRVVHEGILTAIRAEEGCERYDYYLSVQDPDELLLIEQWTTPAHQRAHMTTPHMARLAQIKAELTESTTLQPMEEAPVQA